MPIGCAVLMCHAPIVVPSIAGPRAPDCRSTTHAMGELARTVLMHEPELIVLVSPHAPRRPDSWGIAHGAQLSGSFARFGHPELSYTFLGAPRAARGLSDVAERAGLLTHDLPARALDHGALVPLYFLREAGYRGEVLLVALPFPGTGTEQVFGQAIATASKRLHGRWAVLASGDMSHRLTHDAPAGFDPHARDFDSAFVSHLRKGDVSGAVAIDAALAERAAEDVLQSTEVALGAVGEPRGTRVLSYEGPFGVGYCEALLHSDAALVQISATPPRELAEIALAAIRAELAGERYVTPDLSEPWHQPRAVFVTLRSPDGELRGCIGRVEPVHRTLAEEVADCAISAATRDHRVARVTLPELGDLNVEVSVLEPAERVDSIEALDPDRYGVVVSRDARRGVLLPRVEGVDTPQDQLRIALQKGHIAASEPYLLERFVVHKVSLGPRIEA